MRTTAQRSDRRDIYRSSDSDLMAMETTTQLTAIEIKYRNGSLTDQQSADFGTILGILTAGRHNANIESGRLADEEMELKAGLLGASIEALIGLAMPAMPAVGAFVADVGVDYVVGSVMDVLFEINAELLAVSGVAVEAESTQDDIQDIALIYLAGKNQLWLTPADGSPPLSIDSLFDEGDMSEPESVVRQLRGLEITFGGRVVTMVDESPLDVMEWAATGNLLQMIERSRDVRLSLLDLPGAS